MRVAIIAAMTKQGVIGKNNALPWHLPEELKYFRKMTLEKPIVMGRKTFESIGKPLPNRHNIVITHNSDFVAPGCSVVNSIEQAIQVAQQGNNPNATSNATEDQEIMVIGGAKLYQLSLPWVSRLYLTIIHQNYEGDTFFPAIDWAEWHLSSEEMYSEFTTQVWDKNQSDTTKKSL